MQNKIILTVAAFLLIATTGARAEGETARAESEVWTALTADVQACVNLCIATYDKPGPELKACVAECMKAAQL